MNDPGPITAAAEATDPVSVALRHATRAARCDFSRLAATTAERAALAAAPRPVTNARVQDLLAWRRSVAWVALVFAAVAIVFALIDAISNLDDFADQAVITGFASFLVVVVFLSKAVLLGCLVGAIRTWPDARRSGRLLLLGWSVAVAVPLLVTLLPLTDLMFDWGAVARDQGVEVAQVNRMFAEVLLAIALFWSAVPSLLALFPGALRAALTVKTLLPTRAVGAVVAAGMAPLYTVFFIVVFGQIVQLSGSAALSIGVLLVALAPTVFVWRARALTQPRTAAEARGWVAAVRTHARVVTAVGLVLVVVGLADTRVFGRPAVGWTSDPEAGPLFTATSAIDLVCWFVAMLGTYTVVATDALLRLMHVADRKAAEWRDTPGRPADDETLEAAQA